MNALVVKNRNENFADFVERLQKKREGSEGYNRRYYEKIDEYYLRNAQK